MEQLINMEIVAQVGTIIIQTIVVNMMMMTLRQAQCAVHAKVYIIVLVSVPLLIILLCIIE